MAARPGSPNHNFNVKGAPGSIGASKVAGHQNTSTQAAQAQQTQPKRVSYKAGGSLSQRQNKAQVGGGNQTTTVAFEAWVNSLCPPGMNLTQTSTVTTTTTSQTTTVPNRLAASGTGRKTSKGQAIKKKPPTMQHNQRVAHTSMGEASETTIKVCQSEVSYMQSNQSVNFYESSIADPPREDESSSSMIMLENNPDEHPIDYPICSNEVAGATRNAVIKEKKKALANKIDELDMINQQLAQETEYVEGLRKNLRIAESRQKALQKTMAHHGSGTGMGGTVAKTTRKNAVLLGQKQSPQGRLQQTATPHQRRSGEEFWSDAQIKRVKQRKFQLDKASGEAARTTRRQEPLQAVDHDASNNTLLTMSMLGTTMQSHEEEEGSGSFEASASEVILPTFTNTQREPQGSSKPGLLANQSAFFEEYKQNLRKIQYQKKATSPTYQNSRTQRLATTAKPINKVNIGSPTHIAATMRTGKNTEKNNKNNNSLPSQQKSRIGSGLFKREGSPRVQPDDKTVARQPNSFAMAASMRPPQEACHAFQGATLEHSKVQNLDDDEICLVEEKDLNEEQGHYDFDRYEILSTSNQMQHLLSQKQDTPKGSSASENAEDESMQDAVLVEYVRDSILNATRSPNKTEMQNQSISNADDVFEISPDVARQFGHHNSMLNKRQQTERKPVSGGVFKSFGSIEPFQSVPQRTTKDNQMRTRQIMSPQRSRPGMLESPGASHPMATQQNEAANSFLGSYHKMQSPPVKNIRHGVGPQTDHPNQLTASQASQKRTNLAQRHHQASPTANQLAASQGVADVKAFVGSPAVPPLRTKAGGGANSRIKNNQTAVGGLSRNQAQSPQAHQQAFLSGQQSNPWQYASTMDQNLTTSHNRTSVTFHHKRARLNSPRTNQESMQSPPPNQAKKGAENSGRSKQESSGQKKTKVAVTEKPADPRLEEKSLMFVLQFLLQEEEWLDQLHDLASSGNFQEMSAQGLLLPRFNPEFASQTLYASLFQAVQLPKQRPKVFSTQLNIYVVMAALITELLVLDQPTMRKFASKLDDVLKNCHQNFLLMIDFILSSAGEDCKTNIDYVLLRKVIDKKLECQVRANRLTQFRQKNELSRAFLKRIASELADCQLAKSATTVQELCAALLETLRMTIDEAGMDITKNQANQKRVVQKLDQIYDLTVSATQAVKIASKKAHIKQTQQLNSNERKVKSVMRGQRLNLHNSAQKQASPLPKRIRNLYTSQNTGKLESKISGHLFGANSSINEATEGNAAAEYLHTVEETENAEASPTKSALQLMSDNSLQSPALLPTQNKPVFKNQTPTGASEYVRDKSFKHSSTAVMPSERDTGLASFQLNLAASNAQGGRAISRRGSLQDARVKTVRRVNTFKPAPQVTEPKNTKTSQASGQRKATLSRQGSRSPQSQRKGSPLKQAAAATNVFKSIVIQQSQELTEYATSNSGLLPENLAFVLANSRAQPSRPEFSLAVHQGDLTGREPPERRRTYSARQEESALLEKPAAQRDAIATTQRGVPRRGTFERKQSHLRNTSNEEIKVAPQEELQTTHMVDQPQAENVVEDTDEPNKDDDFEAIGAMHNNLIEEQQEQQEELCENLDPPDDDRLALIQLSSSSEQKHDSATPSETDLDRHNRPHSNNKATPEVLVEPYDVEPESSEPAQSHSLREISLFTQSAREDSTPAGGDTQLTFSRPSAKLSSIKYQQSLQLDSEKQPSSFNLATPFQHSELEGDDDLSLTDEDDDNDDDGSLILGRTPEQFNTPLQQPLRGVVGAAVGAVITPRDQNTSSFALIAEESKGIARNESAARAAATEEVRASVVSGRSPVHEQRASSGGVAGMPFEPAQVVDRRESQRTTSGPRFSIPLSLDKLQRTSEQSKGQQAVKGPGAIVSPPNQIPTAERSYLDESLSSRVFQSDVKNERVAAVVSQDSSQLPQASLEETKQPPDSDIRAKFGANNFITPRDNYEPKSTGRKATVSLGEAGNNSSEKTGPTQSQGFLSLKITEQLPKEEVQEDGTMQHYVEGLLGAAKGGRRTSTRVNSLLFEEDSLQIKREMVRQKQAKYRENLQQRVSLKHTVGGAIGSRRSTRRLMSGSSSDDEIDLGPNSARNTVSYAEQTRKNLISGSEVFEVSSALDKQLTGQQAYRSQSLVDHDSADAKSSTINNARNTDLDKSDLLSYSKISSDLKSGVVMPGQPLLAPQLPLESPEMTTQFRIETQQYKESEEIKQPILQSPPFLNPVKIESPRSGGEVVEQIGTPPFLQQKSKQRKNDILVTPVEEAADNAMADKGVKSAANAELYAFYQSLIPQNSKEKDPAGGFNLRSKSMVTNFMDIPDARPSEDKDEPPPNRTSSIGYSNHGTFQTPERGRSSSISPMNNNFMRDDVIQEATAEDDDMTAGSRTLPPAKQNFQERRESFKTHAFESIDSFVQLENQLAAGRGESIVSEINRGFEAQDPSYKMQHMVEDEEHEYEGGVPGSGNASSNMIDDEQEQIDAELALLRQQVSIPYLPPIDTSIIDETEVYTLVLDLDETLIHYECDDADGDYYLIRPGAIKFLKEMALYYEIVIFTAAMPEYADKIVDNLDESGYMIKYRLYRQHTTPTEDYAIKDLHLLGRKLERTIIVDNLAENFLATTPNNGIWVESWYDDMQDQVLPRLQRFLQELVEEQVPDVRKVLTQEIKEEIIYACLESNQPIPPVSEILQHIEQ